ncbi:hypothetical protein KY290_001317 [Solanum tuberosum]|uniref:Uncharacterized protein n=1 Tax=Solanum tuberosum TaxID=4113 RepID=A0ABQ7WLV9_SOLTU|nr:hypothetical protein KY290_001317 [Solanum tuberosum]
MAPPKNCWPTDCDVLYDQAKGELILDPSKPIPPHLGPKYLHFESRVIAHIIGTTLLPRAGSHSTLTQHDPLFVYCLVSCIKVHIYSFTLSAMMDVISDPLAFRLGCFVLCYNSRAFQSMDFIHSGSSWILKVNSEDLGDKHEKGKTSSSTSVSTAKLNAALENMDAMQAKLDVVSISVSQVVDFMTKLATMGGQVDSLKDLLLVAHYKIYNVKDVSKEIGADVARICLRLDQIVKEAIKIATKVQPVSKAISTSLSSKFEEMSTAIVNTLTYFLRPR